MSHSFTLLFIEISYVGNDNGIGAIFDFFFFLGIHQYVVFFYVLCSANSARK